MPTPLSRLQIAQQLHVLLEREIGHSIEIERLLGEPRYARDVLLVCDALPNAELRALAALFRGHLPQAAAASARAPAPQAVQPAKPAPPAAGTRADTPGHAQQPTEWSRDTSGFGLSRPAPVGPAADTRPGEVGQDRPAAQPRSSWLARLTRW